MHVVPGKIVEKRPVVNFFAYEYAWFPFSLSPGFVDKGWQPALCGH